MRNRVNLNCPNHYAVIYTVSGEDPSFPIVGEIVHVLSPHRVSTTPTKWSMNGHASVVPHNFSSSEYSFSLNVSEIISDDVIPISDDVIPISHVVH